MEVGHIPKGKGSALKRRSKEGGKTDTIKNRCSVHEFLPFPSLCPYFSYFLLWIFPIFCCLLLICALNLATNAGHYLTELVGFQCHRVSGLFFDDQENAFWMDDWTAAHTSVFQHMESQWYHSTTCLSCFPKQQNWKFLNLPVALFKIVKAGNKVMEKRLVR